MIQARCTFSDRAVNRYLSGLTVVVPFDMCVWDIPISAKAFLDSLASKDMRSNGNLSRLSATLVDDERGVPKPERSIRTSVLSVDQDAGGPASLQSATSSSGSTMESASASASYS